MPAQSKSIYKTAAPSLSSGLLLFFLLGGTQALYGPTLQTIGAAFGQSVQSAALLLSVHGLGTLLAALALGVRPFLLGRQRIGVALSILTVGTLLLGFAPFWMVALLGALLIGVGFGILAVRINTIFAAQGSSKSNLINTVFGVGAVLSPLLTQLPHTQGKVVFLLMALLGALLHPLAYRMHDAQPEPAAGQQQTHPSGKLWILFLVLMVVGGGIEASTSLLASHLVAMGQSAAQAATATSLFFLTFTLSRLAAVWISARVSPSSLVAGALTLTLVLLVLACLLPSAWWLLVLCGGGVAVFFPNVFSWLIHTVPGAQHRSGAVMAAALTAGMVFPLVVSQVVAATGGTSLPYVLIVLTALTLMVVLFLRRQVKNATPEP
ncbi:MFS transporter [Deinococcus roseus]|uniref:MFS transporter n=1 Tax=Deinococcus roseus TaxID=392414 RepID=A0ABQ2D2V6_9DEIO|nr:MFS transporter [Deinococcus roseus]GGJ42920.1 hypothetical protein GCM10008938_31390 [Deinococcus roseus]